MLTEVSPTIRVNPDLICRNFGVEMQDNRTQHEEGEKHAQETRFVLNLSYDGGGGLYVPPILFLFFTKNLSPRPNP